MPDPGNLEIWKVILQAVAALVGIATLVWTIIRAIKGPKLKISLPDPKGHLTRFGDSPDAPLVFFYHLSVRNQRKWTAKNVRVKITNLTEFTPDKLPVNWPLRTSVFLMWSTKFLPTLYLLDVSGFDAENCNLGYIMQGREFQLDAMDPARVGQNEKWPSGFQGFLHANETMQLELVALAEEAMSNTLHLTISWDGQWHEQPGEMKKHLVVSTTKPGILGSVLSRLGIVTWARKKVLF